MRLVRVFLLPGFSTSQAAYDKAVADVNEGMTAIEKRLGQSRFVVGDQLTLAGTQLQQYSVPARVACVFISFSKFECL